MAVESELLLGVVRSAALSHEEQYYYAVRMIRYTYSPTSSNVEGCRYVVSSDDETI